MTFASTLQPLILRAMASFVSQDETRLVMNGICVDFTDGKLSVIATDGRRLACHRPDWDTDRSGDVRFIIPPSILNALPYQVSRPPWRLEWEKDTSKLTLSGPDYSISTRTIDGNYPDWRGVVPDPMPTQFPADITVAVNAEFLNDCVILLDQIEDDGPGIQPVCAGQDQPIIFHNKHTTLILMPMRITQPFVRPARQ